MNIRQAIDDTMALADRLTCPKHCAYDVSKEHLQEMHAKIKSNLDMSDTKLSRWLGWMQASVVSWGVANLDDMIRINMENRRENDG